MRPSSQGTDPASPAQRSAGETFTPGLTSGVLSLERGSGGAVVAISWNLDLTGLATSVATLITLGALCVAYW